MPNWCTNTLKVVSENEEKFKEFIDSAFVEDTETQEKKKFTFEVLYPTPPELLDTAAFSSSENSEVLIEKYEHTNWYSWRVDKWGTKWDASYGWSEIEKTGATIWFDTAWAPPIAWLEFVAEKFPELQFTMRYEEPGVNFCGVVEFIDGECTRSDEGAYEYADPETAEPVEFNSETEKWHFKESGELVSDDDTYWPDNINPYE
jgi:hypothetical protein